MSLEPEDQNVVTLIVYCMNIIHGTMIPNQASPQKKRKHIKTKPWGCSIWSSRHHPSSWDDHEAKLHPWICRSLGDRLFTLSQYNERQQNWSNQNTQTTDRNRQVKAIPWWLQEFADTCWAQSLSQTEMAKLNGNSFFFMRSHELMSRQMFGIRNHDVETIQFWGALILTHTWWPWRSWAAHFDHHRMHLKGTFGPEFPFGHAGKLTQRPLCQAEETFACWEGKQMRGNGGVSWGLRRLIMGIQSAKIKQIRELVAAAGQCSWQSSPSRIHVQTMLEAATNVRWSC